MTGQMLEKVEDVLQEGKPDIVLVYGDTNTTIAGALAAAKLHIPIAHVEAGLRSFNRRMPEEINRVVTDHVSSILFCPTKISVENLVSEGIGVGISQEHGTANEADLPKLSLSDQPVDTATTRYDHSPKVALVGDVMYDSVLYYARLAEKNSRIMESLKLSPKSFGLATVHRAENTDNTQRLNSIFRAFEKIAMDGLPIVVPLHPRTKKILTAAGKTLKNVHIIDPVSYLDMIALEKQARIIMTDSGGVQKEAFWFKVPCITLRDETEWVETVASGWNVVVGADFERIKQAVMDIKLPESQPSFYGNGDAAKKIVTTIRNHTSNI
jgi:UDP-N-acetylglucosamine 2-epimerase